MTNEERIEALERRVAELEKQALPFQPFGPLQNIGPIRDDKCYFCGGQHGGLPCPTVTPMSEST